MNNHFSKVCAVIILIICLLAATTPLPTIAQKSTVTAGFIVTGTANPNCARVGQVYINTSAGALRRCTVTGTPGTWVDVGGGGTDSALTTPIITTGIKDQNGNLILGFTPTGSADDYPNITNGTSSVTYSAAGADTNIPVTFTGKGTGINTFGSNNAHETHLRGGSGVYVGSDAAVMFEVAASNLSSTRFRVSSTANVSYQPLVPSTNGSTTLGTSALGWQQLFLDATLTGGGTVGAQTINKSAGSVNFAAAATSLVVTNSKVTASSIVICTVQTNDATLTSVQCVPTSGSFTMYANAAATGETKVGFIVINQ